jgi:hypothetical protein
LIAIEARPRLASDDATAHGAPPRLSVNPWPKIATGQPPAGFAPAGTKSVNPSVFIACTTGVPVAVPYAGMNLPGVS